MALEVAPNPRTSSASRCGGCTGRVDMIISTVTVARPFSKLRNAEPSRATPARKLLAVPPATKCKTALHGIVGDAPVLAATMVSVHTRHRVCSVAE